MNELGLAVFSLVFLLLVFVFSLKVLYRMRTPKAPIAGRPVLSPEEQRVLQARLAKQADRLRREREEDKRREAIATAKPSLYQEKLRLREEKRLEEEAAEIERNRRENAEYNAWKTRMVVTDGGEMQLAPCASVEELIKHFSGKWTDITEAAVKFKIPVNQLVQRIEDLENLGIFSGILDDRGRYLTISKSELGSIREYVHTLSARKPIRELTTDINKILAT